jgi:hypothetical protein
MLGTLPCAAGLTHGKVPILCTQLCAGTRQRTRAGNPNFALCRVIFLAAHGKHRAHGKDVDLISFRQLCPNRFPLLFFPAPPLLSSTIRHRCRRLSLPQSSSSASTPCSTSPPPPPPAAPPPPPPPRAPPRPPPPAATSLPAAPPAAPPRLSPCSTSSAAPCSKVSYS